MSESIRILIVEDLSTDAELAIREIRKTIVNCVFQRVETKPTFLDALTSFDPDLILSDYHLPRFTGMEVLNLVKINSPSTPCIIFTGSVNEEAAVECMKAGASNYIIKENIKRLGSAILHALEEKKVLAERKLAQNALLKSEARYRQLVEGAPDIVYTFSTKRGGIYYSPRVEQILGYSPSCLLENPRLWIESIHPEDRVRIDETLQLFGIGKSFVLEYRIRDVNGNWHWLMDRSLGSNFEGDDLLIEGVATDITERKKTEHNLLQRTEDLQLIKALNDAANRGEDIVLISHLFSEEARRIFNCQDINIYFINKEMNYLEMQSSTVSQIFLDKIEKMVGRQIPRVRIPLTEDNFFKEIIECEQATLLTDRKNLERWLAAFSYTTTVSKPVRQLFLKFVPQIIKMMHIQSVIIVPLVFKDQTIGLLDITSSKVMTDEIRQRIQIISQQVTAIVLRKQAEKQVQIQNKRLNALRVIDLAISSSLDMHLSLEILLNEVVSQLNVDAVDILLLDQADLSLEYVSGKGFRNLNMLKTHLQLGEGIAGRVGSERKTIHIVDINGIEDKFIRCESLKEDNFVEYIGIPLVAKGTLKGVLEIFSRSELETDSEWLNYLETIGGQAAIAIDNVQMFDGLQQSNQDLLAAYDATIMGWSRAMDLRDKETEGHTQRVTSLTLKLAAKMGISQQELVQVRRGALLHDIGKLGIPDHILLKPGKLTDEEWVIMRQHTTFAFDMLMPIAYLRPALDIPYCHHEKWDGSGYPRGLKGESIPLVARIFSIIDVWDALRSDRPYRPSWTVDQVRKHVTELSGTHFDPKVVEAFLSIIDEIPEM